MSVNLLIKISTIILYSFFTIIRINFSRLANKGKKMQEVQESRFRLSFLQAYIISTIVLFFLYIFFPQWFDWGSIPNYPLGVRIAGIGVGAFALLLFFWVHMFLGKMFSYTLVIRDDHSLITNGPYRFIRHPMYTAFIIFHTSIFLIIGNWFYGIVWIIGLFFVLALRIRKEEEMLVDVFNEEYELYMQKTGALFFPFFSMFRSGKRNLIFHQNWTFKAIYQEEMEEDNLWILEWLKRYILHYDDYHKNNVEIFVHNKLSQNYLSFLKNYTTISAEGFQQDGYEIVSKKLLEQYPLVILIQDKAEKESLKLFIQLDKQSEILEYSLLEAVGSKNYVHTIKNYYEQSMIGNQQYQMLQFGP